MWKCKYKDDRVCRRFFWRLKVTLFFFVAFAVSAVEAYQFSDESRSLLGTALIIEDPTSSLSIDEVVDMEDGQWELLEKTSFGLTRSTFWLRLDISELSEKDWFLVNRYGTLANFKVWARNEKSRDIRYIGDLGFKSGDARPVSSHFIVQPILENRDKAYTYFISVRSDTPILLRLYLLTSSALTEVTTFENIFLSIWFGAVVCLCFYNMFLIVQVREKAYLWYCVYVAVFAWVGTFITGHNYQYFGPSELGQYIGVDEETSGNLLILGIAVSIIGMINYCRYFIGTPKLMPRTDRVLFWVNVIAFCLAIPKLMIRESAISVWLFPLQNILLWVLLVLAIIAIRKGVTAAKYYFCGWAIFTIGMTTYVFSMRGYIENPGFFQIYAAQFASIVEMILLSQALGAKLIAIKQERIESEMRARKEIEDKNNELVRIQESVDRENIINAKKIEALSVKLRSSIRSLEKPLRLFYDTNLGKLEQSLVVNGIRNIEEITRYAVDLEIYGALQSENLQLKPREKDVYSLCSSMLQKFSAAADAKGIDLLASGMPDSPDEKLVLLFDEVRCRQVLTNLLDNAIKFTERGSVTLYLDVRRRGDDTYVVIQVVDTGVGIAIEDEEDIEKLFDGQFRPESSYASERQGVGLGLNISRKLARLHGGDVVFIQSGRGTIFEFRFKTGGLASADGAAQKLDTETINDRILYVGDRHNASSCLHSLHKKMGVPTNPAKGYVEYSEFISTEIYSYVFIDDITPIDEVFLILSHFKTLPRGNRPNFVILARWHSYRLPPELSDMDFLRIIRTPLEIEDFLNLVTSASFNAVSGNNVVALRNREEKV